MALPGPTFRPEPTAHAICRGPGPHRSWGQLEYADGKVPTPTLTMQAEE